MNDPTQNWIVELEKNSILSAEQKRRLVSSDDRTIEAILEQLVGRQDVCESIDEPVMSSILATFVEREVRTNPKKRELPARIVDWSASLYRRLGNLSGARHHLLSLFAMGKDGHSLATLAELLASDPPSDARLAALPIVALVQRPGTELAQLFPKLLEGLRHEQVAAPILDLANYMSRNRLIARHPAESRIGQINELLADLVRGLESVTSSENEKAPSVDSRRKTVSDAVSLVISLCDTISLLKDTSSKSTLRSAMRLPHRRVQVEAAYALASVEDASGAARLAELAAEPVVRLRAIAYADELDLLDQIDASYRSGEARAEAQLISWLAEPTAMGIPPSHSELVDSRTQYWPSYDEPVECFLFRFMYTHPEGTYSNVGIAGPVTFSLSVDLNDLAPDDIYAVYAGWHAEHDEIRLIDLHDVSKSQELELNDLERKLAESNFREINSVCFGSLFGDAALIAYCQRRGLPGIAIIDSDDVIWFPTTTTQRPFGPEEIYHLYTGRKLLRNFND